ITPEQLAQLPATERQAIEKRGRRVEEEIASATREIRGIDKSAREKIAALEREVARFVAGPILEELRSTFKQSELLAHFDAIEKDILNNVETLKSAAAASAAPGTTAPQDGREPILRRYEVNLFVTHGDEPPPHAPIVDERQPTYQNLFGHIDYEQRLGAVTTDFTMVQPGAIHKANGGYLILQAPDLMSDPRCWVQLKRALKTKEAGVGDYAERPTPVPVISLTPEPIPLDLKVILVGPPLMIAMLEALDPGFRDLFKIRADFEPDTPISEEALAASVGFVRRSVEQCGLRHFDRAALVEILRYSSRLAGRQDRLTTQLGAVGDLCQEANQIAAQEGAEVVSARQVQGAIAGMRRRSGLVPDRLRRSIADGTLRIETEGAVVGQVNGLAVYRVGRHSFGTPMRITCRSGAGTLGIVNIEREVERSGAIHTKGVLVLSGYLTGTFGRTRPLSFTASLTFEQSYDEVDGDSASSAELYAILASLARVPLRQDIAVTGSVDQFGHIQPVGGVSEKIEGFYDVCQAKGLTGEQGVIIPDVNAVNLTLRDDVVEAVAAGQFQIWTVKRIEAGLELLTAMKAGELDADGTYPAGTLFRKVTDALAAMQAAAPFLVGKGRRAPAEPMAGEAAERQP
ncbi:MAG: Lon protease family protein, partial [Dehalococcoidia bacterium]